MALGKIALGLLKVWWFYGCRLSIMHINHALGFRHLNRQDEEKMVERKGQRIYYVLDFFFFFFAF